MKFNSNLYQPRTDYTREMAEKVMIENGYVNFHFTGMSYTNGASFYFESEGKKIRVSDHNLTGKRAFEVIQLDIVKVKKASVLIKKQAGVSDLMKGVYLTMLKKGAITEEDYNNKINGK